MSISSASINPLSTQALGTIPAIFRDDNASYYSVGALANGGTQIIIDGSYASLPDSAVLLVVTDDATWGRSCGVFMVNSTAVYELVDTASKYAASDAGTFIRIYLSSTSLIIKNSTGADLAAGAVRIYRLT